jgi:hypothetical protein
LSQVATHTQTGERIVPRFNVRIKRTITADVPIDAESIEAARRSVNNMSRDDLFDMWYDSGADESDNIKVAHVK